MKPEKPAGLQTCFTANNRCSDKLYVAIPLHFRNSVGPRVSPRDHENFDRNFTSCDPSQKFSNQEHAVIG
jgi:hypothetical protein